MHEGDRSDLHHMFDGAYDQPPASARGLELTALVFFAFGLAIIV